MIFIIVNYAAYLADMPEDDCTLIGIDWGTSRLRAFNIGSSGQILDRRESDRGIAAMGDRHFDMVLRELVKGWASGVPILMCGMIGSRQGWREVPYRLCPASVSDFASSLSAVESTLGPAWIVAGASTMEHHKNRHGQGTRGVYDVMRGEETQIFGAGLPIGNTLVITPGTHSKWSVVQGGAIERFRTSMTGELYALLRNHSILRSLMEAGAAHPHNEESFLDGLHVGLDEPALLHSLFSVRTRALFRQQNPATLDSYLSGVLIGSEMAEEARRCGMVESVHVVATPELGRLYRVALSAAGFSDVRLHDAEGAVAQGLWKLWQLRGASS